MPQAAAVTPLAAGHDLVTMARGAVAAGEAILADATAKVRERVTIDGRIVSRTFDREQRATHGLGVARDLRRGGAPARRLRRAHAIDQPARRDRGSAGPHRARRVPRADPRRHSDQPGRDRAAVRPRPDRAGGRRARHARSRHADRVGQHGVAPCAPRRADARRQDRDGRRLRPRRHAGIDPRGDAQVRRQRGDRPRAGLAPHQQLHPDGGHRPDGGPRRVRPHHPRGIRRHGARQGIDVRRLRGAVARLYRCRLARHPHRNRGRADPRQRHRGAEEAVAAQARLRRGAADRGVHRAQHRLGPRLDQDPRRQGRRRLSRPGQQDLDHASGARRPDDAAGAHQSEGARLSRHLHAARREAARR